MVSKSKLHIALLVVVSAIAFLVNNQVLAPDIMEARNMVTAREMATDGHWLVPTMNGELRLEKPPLPTWLTAATWAISPDSVALQRGMAGLAAMLMVLCFYGLVADVTGRRRTALLSALILCTCYNVVLMGRTATWDIYCHAFAVAALWALVRALQARGRGWGAWATAGVCAGLSFMSKGPISIYGLMLPFVVAYCAVFKPRMRGKWMPLALMLLLTVVVGGWWYGYLYAFRPNALLAVTHKETGNWTTYNTRPWWYYWRFWAEAGVWAVLLLTAMVAPLCRRAMRRDPAYRMMLGWMLLSVVLLSLFPEKKMRYLLPVMIPASGTMGWLLDRWMTHSERLDRRLYRLNAWLVVAVLAALPVALWVLAYRPGHLSLPLLIASAVLLWGIAAWIGSGACQQPRQERLVLGVVAAFAVIECLLMPTLGYLAGNPERHSLRLSREVPQLQGLPFYYPQGDTLRIEEVWAAGRNIMPIDTTRPDSLKAHLPMALLTHRRVGQALPPALWQSVDTVWIDRYDDNNRPPSYKKRYDPIFIYNVTILKEKDK